MYKSKNALLISPVVRSYLKSDAKPEKPVITYISEGDDYDYVNIEWGAVADAVYYEIARSANESDLDRADLAEYIIATTTETSYSDFLPSDAYYYYYKIIAVDSLPSDASDVRRGYAHRPPANFKASAGSATVALSWELVDGATDYTIMYSETEDGTYTLLIQLYTNQTDGNYTHDEEHLTESRKDFWYKINVSTEKGATDYSEPVKGTFLKIAAPENVRLNGNRTATKVMTLLWDEVDGAKEYKVYQATLAHMGASADKLKDSDYNLIATTASTVHTINYTTYPIRRHVYRVVAVDRDDVQGPVTDSEVVLRYPVDTDDFLKDVDFTIQESQQKIRNFGWAGVIDTSNGLYAGKYSYSSSTLGSKYSTWENYTSFEISVTGSPGLTVNMSEMSAKLSGDNNVTGYELGNVGKLTYNDLDSLDGGYAFAGGLTVTYYHPTAGTLTKYYNYVEAASLMMGVRLQGQSSAGYPSFEKGGGY